MKLRQSRIEKTTISKWCAANKNLTANRAASTCAAFLFLLYFYVFNVHSVSFPSGPACPSDLPLFPIWDSACYSSYFQSLWFQHSHLRLHSLKSLPFTSLTAISTLNSISGPPKKYVQTDGDPTAINTARRTRVHLCVRDSEHLLLSTSVASLHLVTLWSNLGKRRKTPRAAPPSEEYSARGMCKKPKIRIECFTSIVFDGEVVVVGNFWSKAECEALPVAHLIFVHRRNRFNDLNHRWENIFAQKREHPLNSRFDVQTLPFPEWQTRTWAPRCWSRTLGGCRSRLWLWCWHELWCLGDGRLHADAGANRQIQHISSIEGRFLLVLEYACACLSSSTPPHLTMNNSHPGYLSISASQATRLTPDIYVRHTATLNLRCSYNIDMSKEALKDKRCFFFFVCTHFWKSISTMPCIFVILVRMIFHSTLLLQAVHLASQSLWVVSVAYSGPRLVGGELGSIWPSGV